MQIADLQNLLMATYRFDSLDYIVGRAKRLLKDWVEGRYCDSYARLLEYIKEIKPKNIGSICSCISQNPNGAQLLKRLFISFEVMIAGFLSGCRPFIVADGCFLKEP